MWCSWLRGEETAAAAPDHNLHCLPALDTDTNDHDINCMAGRSAIFSKMASSTPDRIEDTTTKKREKKKQQHGLQTPKHKYLTSHLHQLSHPIRGLVYNLPSRCASLLSISHCCYTGPRRLIHSQFVPSRALMLAIRQAAQKLGQELMLISPINRLRLLVDHLVQSGIWMWMGSWWTGSHNILSWYSGPTVIC